MTSMNQDLIKVPRSFLETFWTCRICSRIITNALSIPECLHFFCAGCIRGLIIKEKVTKCPVCQTEMGCNALDKLRVDHTMADIRKRFIIPDKNSVEKGQQPESESESEEGGSEELSEPTFDLASKKKEKSLSSLGKSPINPKKNVGRPKSRTTKALVIQEPSQNNEKSSSRFAGPKSSTDKGKGKMVDEMSTLAVCDHDDDFHEPAVTEQPRRTRRGRPRKTTTVVGCEEAVESGSGNCEKELPGIWMALIASDQQEGRPRLPQIDVPYLRIKNVNLTVSFLKKYIMHKLRVRNEDEVEISMWGEPVISSTKLYSLIDMWPTNESIETTVGASAEDFVMTVCYGRKSLPKSHHL